MLIILMDILDAVILQGYRKHTVGPGF
jgi:hypothetical protein